MITSLTWHVEIISCSCPSSLFGQLCCTFIRAKNVEQLNLKPLIKMQTNKSGESQTIMLSFLLVSSSEVDFANILKAVFASELCSVKMHLSTVTDTTEQNLQLKFCV